MRGTAEARSAGFARKALFARRKKIVALAAGLRVDGDMETREDVGALQAAEARELAEIEAALQRLARGTYGTCERCGELVGELRLQAVPEARRCMACAGIQ